MSVILVGAGPGGRALLTLRGLEAIRAAEIVIYDRLVDPDIRSLIPEHAETIDVGKESGSHPVPQEAINRLLVEKGQAGKRVVRLKGGDCFLFGRGGEECEALRAAGVSFEVVPGVTSALAAPAFAGIPVTHRDCCSSVHIVTAHAQKGADLSIDFEALVRTRGTLVFLMGVTALQHVMQSLLRAGLPGETPAAIVENGTRGAQRKVLATADTLYDRASQAQIESPAVIVVGAVCALSDTLDWFTPLPLHGKRIVVTRPKERAGTLSQKLRALGAEVMECPCIATESIQDDTRLSAVLHQLAQYQWLVLTSPAGVSALYAALRAEGLDMRALYALKLAVVGAGTGAALARFGIHADLCPSQYEVRALAETLCDVLAPGERVLVLRAETGSPALCEVFDKNQVNYEDIPLYRTRYLAQENHPLRDWLRRGQVDAVTFTSASTVEGFMRAFPTIAPYRFAAVCIGEQTALSAKAYGLQVWTAKNATLEDMIQCMLEELPWNK